MSNSIFVQHSFVNGSLATLTGGLFSTAGSGARGTPATLSTNIPQASNACLTVETEFLANTATATLVRCFRQNFLGLAGVSGVALPGTARVTGAGAAIGAAAG